MSFRKLIFFVLCVFFAVQIRLFPADVTNTMTNSSPAASTNSMITNETNNTSTNESKNIIFDNYDEVFIQNYDKENLVQIKFIGNVKIRFDNNLLKARTVIVTSRSNRVTDITAYDRVEFRYGDQIYLADFMSYDPENKKGLLRNVRSFVKASETGGGSVTSPSSAEGGWYYHAEKGTILSEKRIVLENVTFTFTPSEYPYYHFYAARLWYFKDDLIYAFNVTFTVGEGNFFYFPFFMRWEKKTGIKSALGQERRIGWYNMNTLSFDEWNGSFDIGLDFYERLGQYAMVNYTMKKPVGVIQSLNFYFQGANDIRTFYDPNNDRYTYINPVNPQYSNINQLSYQYTFNSTLKYNDFLLTINWMDLNDPFFVSKYTIRRYDFNLQDTLEPSQNSFFVHDDSAPQQSTITRSFDLKNNALDINGSWVYQLYANNAVSNIYLNSRYQYLLTNVSFPNITYSPANIDIVKNYSYSYPVSKTVQINTNRYEIPLDSDPGSFIDSILTNESNSLFQSNTMDTDTPTDTDTGISSNSVKISPYDQLFLPEMELSNTVSSSKSTNNPIVYWLSTNNFEVYNYSSYLNGSFLYSSEEYVDTNDIPTYNHYIHHEEASVENDFQFVNRLIYFKNSFVFNNYTQWSMFQTELTNNINNSGQELDYVTTLGVQSNYSIFSGMPYQVNFPYNVYYNLTYPIVDTFNSLIVNFAPEDTHNIGFNAGFNMIQTNINYNLNVNYEMQYRITNQTNLGDVYLDDLMERSLSIDTSFTLFWITFSTGTAFNLLETTTNTIEFNYDSLTNCIFPGRDPMLTVQFLPPPAYQPLPSMTYVYDILQQTNVSITFNSTYSLPPIYTPYLYKIEALKFNAVLHWDFLSPLNTYFDMTFNSTVWIDRYWALSYSTEIKNISIYRYFQSDEAYFYPGDTVVDFWSNFADGLNFFDINSLEQCLFKVEDLHFSIIHYLNEWEMDITFDLARRIDTTRMIAFWEPSILIEFKLNGSDTYPSYQKNFVPPQYQ